MKSSSSVASQKLGMLSPIRPPTRALVGGAVAPDGGDDAERDADDGGDQEPEDDQLERDRERVDEDVRDRLGVAEREAEVALEDAADPAPVLLG